MVTSASSVHGALINPNRERVQFVINVSLMAAFIVTYIFGVVGYLYAYDDTKGNILLNFDPKDSVILLGRIGYGVTLMAAIPMVTVPCRDAFLSLVPQYSAWKYQRSVYLGHDNYQPQEHAVVLQENKLSESTALLRKESDYETASPLKKTLNSSKKQDDVMNNKVSFYFATSIILLFAFFGATFAPGVATVWSICGSGMAFIIAFILPAACYIKIRHQRKGHSHRIIVVSWILLLGSISCAIACTSQTIYNLFY
jgi:amino acid permease